jgi:hypothetical protein
MEPPQDIEQHIKTLYNTYRHTTSPSSKGHFFSPTCLQICRPDPSYAATTRAQIVQYLQDAERGKVPLKQNADSDNQPRPRKENPVAGDTARYTIRSLVASEHTFGDGAATAAIGLTPAKLQAKAEAEGWIGMRVDLWDEGVEEGLLVKVQYWWRLEAEGNEEDGKVWRQCLHDIMYLGPRDGTEGAGGLEILR